MMNTRENDSQGNAEFNVAAMKELVEGLAHEINNPLLIIKGSSDLLQKKLKRLNLDDATFDKLFENQQSAVERISSMISNIRSLYSSESATFETFNLTELLRSTLSMLHESYRSQGIHWKTNFFAEGVMVDANREQLRQVMVHLLKNAKEATLTKSLREIHVAIDQISSDSVEIKIKDNGPGISGERIDHLFFSHHSTKEVSKGCAMGLAIVQSTVKRFLGSIRCESDATGATFILTFPLSKTVTSEEADEFLIYHPIKGNALVVAKEEDAMALRSLFERLGLLVDYATHEKKALLLTEIENYNYYFIDESVLDMTFEEFVGKLKAETQMNQKYLLLRQGVDLSAARLSTCSAIYLPTSLKELYSRLAQKK